MGSSSSTYEPQSSHREATIALHLSRYGERMDITCSSMKLGELPDAFGKSEREKTGLRQKPIEFESAVKGSKGRVVCSYYSGLKRNQEDWETEDSSTILVSARIRRLY